MMGLVRVTYEDALSIWASVIIQAERDVCLGLRYIHRYGPAENMNSPAYSAKASGGGTVRRWITVYLETLQWFFDDSEDVWAFKFICQHIGADMYAIREVIIQRLMDAGRLDDLQRIIRVQVAA